MIYFIDEDINQLLPFALELEIRGYTVKQIDNADAAFNQLVTADEDDIELILIDVMLATETSDVSRFNRQETKNYFKTGLILLEHLIQQRGDIIRNRSVLYSMATKPWLLSDIEKAKANHNVPFIKKSDYSSPKEFGNKISELISLSK